MRVVGPQVEVLQNTFYTTQGNGLELPGPREHVEVENNVFWADGGYDLWLAGDIRGGFFSDYNDLYAEGSGLLVHWLKDFADVLDWQADVARWDLHSIGRTVVNPEWAQPQFVDLARNDFRTSGLSAGLRLSSPTIDAGEPGSIWPCQRASTTCSSTRALKRDFPAGAQMRGQPFPARPRARSTDQAISPPERPCLVLPNRRSI